MRGKGLIVSCGLVLFSFALPAGSQAADLPDASDYESHEDYSRANPHPGPYSNRYHKRHYKKWRESGKHPKNQEYQDHQDYYETHPSHGQYEAPYDHRSERDGKYHDPEGLNDHATKKDQHYSNREEYETDERQSYKDYGKYDEAPGLNGSDPYIGSLDREQYCDDFRDLPRTDYSSTCLRPRDIYAKLRDAGWDRFGRIRYARNKLKVKARYQDGYVYKLKVDRCTGEILSARPKHHRHRHSKAW